MAQKPISVTNLFQDSGLIQRTFALLRAGLMFKGQRDMYQVYGYKRALTPQDLLARYYRQDIAQRIVDTPCEETWSYPPEIVSDDKDFLAKWTDFIDAQVVDLWPALTQADKLCAFDEFSVLLLGLPGAVGTPATPISGPDKIAYMQAYGAGNVKVEKLVQDESNPRFGQPETYRLTTTGPTLQGATSAGKDLTVHHTRILHIADKPLQGKLAAPARLGVVSNLLDDLLKVGGGSAETYWLTANRGMQIDVDKDMQLGTTDAQELSDEIDEFQHQLRRYIRTRGVTITTLGAEVADPTGPFKVVLALLASATGIPQRILMGAEAGQLASEQDRANWSEFMDRRRIMFAEPWVLRSLIAKLQFLGVLPRTQKPVQFKWPSAFHQSPLETAQTQAQFARSVVNLSRQNMEAFPLVTLEEGRRSLGLPSKPEDGESLPPPPKEDPTPGPFGNKYKTRPKGKLSEQGTGSASSS